MSKKIRHDSFGSPEQNIVVLDHEGLRVEVKRLLSYGEFVNFVQAVTNACFDENGGEYLPEMRDYVTRYAILKIYTNIELPEELDDCYEFVYEHSNLISDVLSCVDEDQFNAADRSISAKIGYIVDTHTNDIEKKFDDLYRSLSMITNMFSEIFDGISEEDVTGVVQALKEAGFDENKFVEIYMNNQSS